jgi:hypothetical protein
MGMNEQERIVILEREVVDLKIRMRVNELGVEELKATVTEIKKNTSKIVWLVGSALILAVLQFIVKGGLL